MLYEVITVKARIENLHASYQIIRELAKIVDLTSEQERRYEQRLLLELKGLRCGFWSGVAQSLIGSVVFVLFVGFVITSYSIHYTKLYDLL